MLSLKWVKSLIVCIILVSISGCFSKKTDPKTGAAHDPNGVLMVQLGGEPTVLNPILSTDLEIRKIKINYGWRELLGGGVTYAHTIGTFQQ